MLPWCVGIGIACLVFRVIRRHRDSPATSALTLRLIDVVPLVLAVLVTAVIWLGATDLLTLVPPNDDGSNHGLFATQILNLHTVTPDRVVVGDVISGSPSSPYYPLALHLVAALVCRLSGSAVATALNLQVLVAVLALPAGMLVLTRRLFPARPSAGAVAAILALCLPAIPYYLSTWGGLPFIVGMAAVPIAVDTAMGAGIDAPRIASGVICGITLIALFALHSSEAVTAVLLTVLLVVGAWLRREHVARERIQAWALAGALLALFLGVQWTQITAGTGNVASAALIPPQSWSDSAVNVVIAVTGIPDPRQVADLTAWLLSWHVLAAIIMWALVVLGAVTALRRRWSPEWVVGLLVVMVLTVASSMRWPGIDAITVPWYSRWDRIVMNELFFLVPLAALAVVSLASLAPRTLPRYAVAGGVVAAVAVPQVAVGAATVHFAFAEGSLASSDQRAAFAWLAQHSQPGDRVLNDPTDGSAWMWALQSVPPLFATAPHQIAGWGDRLFLQRNAAQMASNPAVTAAADEWHVRYAYVGPQVFPAQEAHLSVTDLESQGGWRPVFTAGGSTVLQRQSTP